MVERRRERHGRRRPLVRPGRRAYFIIRGRFELEWSDDAGESGVLELGPDDAVFLAPRWHYRLRCVSDEPGFFVYGMTPTPE